MVEWLKLQDTTLCLWSHHTIQVIIARGHPTAKCPRSRHRLAGRTLFPWTNRAFQASAAPSGSFSPSPSLRSKESPGLRWIRVILPACISGRTSCGRNGSRVSSWTRPRRWPYTGSSVQAGIWATSRRRASALALNFSDGAATVFWWVVSSNQACRTWTVQGSWWRFNFAENPTRGVWRQSRDVVLERVPAVPAGRIRLLRDKCPSVSSRWFWHRRPRTGDW